MKLDRTLIDKDGAPSVKETQEYFKKNNYTTAPNPFDVDGASQKELGVYMKSREIFKKTWLKKHLDMVCVNPLGELIKPSYITAHFPKLLKQYGMRDIRFHDLHHTCASLLVSLDVNMKIIQRYLGHSNMSTTADIYSHLDANATGEAGMKLGELLSENTEG